MLYIILQVLWPVLLLHTSCGAGGSNLTKNNLHAGIADPTTWPAPPALYLKNSEQTGGAIVVFKSADGGQTWQDISQGWPGSLKDEPDVSILFKTARGPVWKSAASDGVLLATSPRGIVRSTDNGNTWTQALSDGGVGIDVARIEGGFAAITYSTTSDTRRVRASYDGGKTWQPIDAGLPAQRSMASIIQVGGNFFCGHPAGIFRSSDKGKTWQLLLPSIEGKVFTLYVSGNVIYAIPRDGGC